MPLYEYKCHSCGKTFEVIQKFADEPLKTHAECGGEVERLLSAPAFHLKGTGWYATDYGKGNGGKPKSAEEKADSASGGKDAKSGDKSDSKAKTESGDSTGSESKSSSAESKPAASPAPASSSESK